MSEMYTNKSLVNEDEAAELLGVTARALQKWREQGKHVPYIKVGGRLIRYRRADIEHFLERNTVQPKSGLLPVT